MKEEKRVENAVTPVPAVTSEATDTHIPIVLAGPILPGDPPQPCPELLTTAEAIRYLRLDEEGGPKRPDKTLQYYREQGLLKSVQVGKRIRYRREDLEAFLASLAN